jgi:diguanylate cyclase (GGDEF)-like protein
MKRSRQPLSVILSDIDFFKRFNDFYGHQEGDACLKAVAKCIQDCLERPVDLVARCGGEEFAVIVPNTPSEGAKHVAEGICTSVQGLRRPHARSEATAFVTLSLGVATIIPPDDGGDATDLVKAADLALYQSKAVGRNRVTIQDLA